MDTHSRLCILIAEVLGMSVLTRRDIGDLLALKGKNIKESRLCEAIRYMIMLGDLVEIKNSTKHKRGKPSYSLRFVSEEALLNYVDDIPEASESPGFVHIDNRNIPIFLEPHGKGWDKKVQIKKHWQPMKIEPQTWFSHLLAFQMN